MVLPLHYAQAEKDYAAAVEASISGGGCTSSRASLVGACYGALATDASIPVDWVEASVLSEHIQKLSEQLVKFRGANVDTSNSKI